MLKKYVILFLNDIFFGSDQDMFGEDPDAALDAEHLEPEEHQLQPEGLLRPDGDPPVPRGRGRPRGPGRGRGCGGGGRVRSPVGDNPGRRRAVVLDDSGQ